MCNCFTKLALPQQKIAINFQNQAVDLRPKCTIQMLDFLRPIYSKTAAHCHFGRDEPNFTWEPINLAATLREVAGLK